MNNRKNGGINGGIFATDEDGNEIFLGTFGSVSVGDSNKLVDDFCNAKSATLSFSAEITPEGAKMMQGITQDKPDGYKVSYVSKKGKNKVKYITVEEGEELLKILKSAEVMLGRYLRNAEKINITKEFLKGKGSKVL